MRETLEDTIDASTATLSSAIVGDEDAATVTYTVTLSTAPTVDETFTFDVDGVERTITVLAGQTTGTTTVAYDDADVFIDEETVGIASNFAASDANGASNYESLTLTNNASGETLEDTIDASTATLSSAIVGDEDAATVTYTVTLSTAPTVDETFTFDVDGVERTITVCRGSDDGHHDGCLRRCGCLYRRGNGRHRVELCGVGCEWREQLRIPDADEQCVW